MLLNTKIKRVKAREILDSRGNPTVEVDITLYDGSEGRAAVPSGASTGEHEALELRDGDPQRYDKKGVLKAVGNVNNEIARAIKGMDAEEQETIDNRLIELDGTPDKSRLGANAILGVSLAVAKAAACSRNLPLYEYIRRNEGIAKKAGYILPVPMMNVMNGGSHADWVTDLQEYMIMPVGAYRFKEAVRMGSEIFHAIKDVLKKREYGTNFGDEGGYSVMELKSNREPLELISEAVEKANYKLGKDVLIALDPAASAFYNKEDEKGKPRAGYCLDREKKIFTSKEMINFYEGLIKEFPIFSIEDGLAENDWEGWAAMTKKLGGEIQIVGDDLYVTNAERLAKGIEIKASNAILIKLNQIGTLTETLKAINMAHKAGYKAIISHRSGETLDTTIAHLAVAMNTGQIKTGSLCRTDRVAKYNELLRIEEGLGKKAVYNSMVITNS